MQHGRRIKEQARWWIYFLPGPLSLVFALLRDRIELWQKIEPSTKIHTYNYVSTMKNAKNMLQGIHHIAIICSDYNVSKHFYTEILGLEVISENYREKRNSYKLDLRLPNGNQIELFSFPKPPIRPSHPEACGLRHLAFAVKSIENFKHHLEASGINVEPVRTDEYTGCRYTFFKDPDGLPLEVYEIL